MPSTAMPRLFAAALLILLVSGCGQLPTRPTPATVPDTDLARAQELMQSQQYAAAAGLYRALAARATDPARRADLLLAAAEASRQNGDWEGVRIALEGLAPMVLDPTSSLQRQLLQAELLLQQGDPTTALATLSPAPAATAPVDLQVRFHRSVAAAYRQMGNLLETANALQTVDTLLPDHQARLDNQTDILRTLALLSERALQELQPSPPGVSGGWMSLALLVKRHEGDPDALRTGLVAWRERFPQHPALPELLQNYQAFLDRQILHASRIGVLLPQSGRFEQIATAIRDGIMISRMELPGSQQPEIRFYDSSDPAMVWPLYNTAVADGAEVVIGPLQKEAVGQLLRAGELPVPVLALNQVPLDSPPPPNLYMYSLSPEDEARQAAEKIWVDGLRRPLLLTPQGEWGDRMTEAFSDRWLELGGEIAGLGRYDEATHDHTGTLTAMLLIDESEQRYREIVQWLGQRVEFEPRRRDDADAVFLAARPVQAQGLRPQLQFHHAADLPIYATSHSWTGVLTSEQVADMKGIRVADIPWLVDGLVEDRKISRAEVMAALPNAAMGYARLYAMGIDALRLVPHLKRLGESRYESLTGTTGNLYMDDVNQVHRQLVWLMLDETPELLGYSPRLDLEQVDGTQLLPLPPEAPADGPRLGARVPTGP
jgi:uncharacterized protein